MTTYIETLKTARAQANLQIANPREKAIVIRYIEDAICRAIAASDLPALSVNEEQAVRPPR